MAVVVDLDAARRPRQTERLRHGAEQALLRRGVGELAGQGLARIGERVSDQFLALATLRRRDLDLAPRLRRQSVGEQRDVLEGVRDQHEPRRRLVVVELRDECAQHLARLERAIGLRNIGAVAPVLTGAEEEHLHAGVAAVLVHGEDVGLLDVARIDALMRLNRRQRGEAVAEDRRVLEVERLRRLVHGLRQFLLHRAAVAGEEFVGLAHELGIAGKIDLARARRRAALDLVQKARPRTALEERVRAGAQQERALQRVDRAVDRAGGGERPVVTAGPRARTAVLEDLRGPVVRGDQDVGERLVVAQQHVEARPQALDQVGLEEQRFRLGLGGDELHRHRRRDHAGDARVIGGRPRVVEDALPDVLGLADVEDVALGVEHAVDAGRLRRDSGKARDRRAAGGERAGRRLLAFELRQRALLVLAQVFLAQVLAGRIDVFLAVHSCPAGQIRCRNIRRDAPAATLRRRQGESNVSGRGKAMPNITWPITKL